MIPILFADTETQFNTNGIGRLSDAISCEVTEERNGQYQLTMEYPVTGAHYSEIGLGCFVYAKASKYAGKQAFEIYEIDKPINGKVQINARHISYRLSDIPTMPFTSDNVVSALNGLKTNAVEYCPFSFWTNKATQAAYKQIVPASIRSRLGGVEGSILDLYGGEYEWDMFAVKLWDRRGHDRGVTLRYGKNLTDLKQEESIENTITGIVPYYSSDNTTVTLPEKVIETEYAQNYAYPRTVTIDLTSEFENQAPTVAQLRQAANRYISSHDIGVPKINLTVSFVHLADTEEYKNIAVLEEVSMCDTVTILFEKLGVRATAKVIKTVFDVLKDRYTKIELGDAKSSLSTRMAEQQKKITEMPSVMQSAIEHATNLITGELGGYVVLHTNDQGKPYEILIMDTEDINTAVNVWRWNQAGWGHSSTGYNGPYTLAATLDGGFIADYIKSGTITGIRFNNGNGTFLVDAAGHLTATSATITGVITATSGTFTGTVNAQGGTFSGNITASGTISGGTISGSTISGGTVSGATITGGSLSIGSLFNVNNNGQMTANGANLYGTVSLISGSGGSTLSWYKLKLIAGNTVILDPGKDDTESADYGITVKNQENYVSFMNPGTLRVGGPSGFSTYITDRYTWVNGTLAVSGNVDVTGNVACSSLSGFNYKARIVDTPDYDMRTLYCLETPSPMFSDIGEAVLDETGKCFVFIDEVFAETVELAVQYQVLLQRYGDGDCWVSERNNTYFTIEGTPGLKVGWMMTAVQRDFDTMRLTPYESPEAEEDKFNPVLGHLFEAIKTEDPELVVEAADLEEITEYIENLVKTEVVA